MESSSVIELSKSAYQNNLKFIRKLAGKNRTVSLVVKGNAYGHGIEEVVPMAKEAGFNNFAVFNYEEAVRVRKAAGKEAEVLIMGYVDPTDMRNAIEKNLSFFVFHKNRLYDALEAATSLGTKARVHIEFDTGMNRTGFKPSKASELIEILKQNKNHLHLEGVCSHLAGAESIANYVRIKKQVKRFNQVCAEFDNKGLTPEYKHLACSAAAIRYPSLKYDLLRIGILQYGFWPSRETLIEYLSKRKNKEDPLDRVITWKSKIMALQSVKAGDYIGYGTTFLANSDMKIGILPVGYGHGFSRSLSNQGRVIIRDKRVRVIGLVNMNAITVDLNDIGQANIGDEVILIGKSGEQEVSVASFGELSEQLNYELLTRLPIDIPRTINT